MAITRPVFYVSDGTGITAETLGHSLLAQFDNLEFEENTLPYIDTVEKAEAVVREINRVAALDEVRPIIIDTIVDKSIRQVIAGANGYMMDVFDTFVEKLQTELCLAPTNTVGKTHSIVDNKHYNVRIDAVHFALDNDDGARTRHYDKADLILVDDGSTDGTRAWLETLAADPAIRVALNPRNLGYAAANNRGAALARGEALTEPGRAGEYLARRLRALPYEVFACLFLDTRHRVIAFEELFRGTLDGAEVHPREVVQRCLAHHAAAVILGHNHPSGCTEPSAADRAVTARLKQALAEVARAKRATEDVARRKAELEARNAVIFAKLEEALTISVEPLNKMFTSVGLNPDDLIATVRSGYSGQADRFRPRLPKLWV